MTKAEQVERYKSLNLSPAEIEELYAYDKAVERGADPMPLTAEQKKVVKKMTNSDTHAKSATPRARVKKENADKAEIVKCLTDSLADWGASDISVTNSEREFTFYFNEVKYKVVLSAPRT